MTVIEEIAAERKRQIDKEGWTIAHDDGHSNGDLARLAAMYAVHNEGKVYEEMVLGWGDVSDWVKLKGRRRDLIRAGALIVAEIERLDRAIAITEKDGSAPWDGELSVTR